MTAIQMEMGFDPAAAVNAGREFITTMKGLSKRGYDPTTCHQLYSLGYRDKGKWIDFTREEVIAEFKKDWGRDPEVVIMSGGGWIVGPVPEKKER